MKEQIRQSDEMESKGRVLLVEDDSENARVAREVLESRGYRIDIVGDYVSASSALRGGNKYVGVVTDCFFPEERGSGRTQEGKNLLGRMIASDSEEQRLRGMFEDLEEYVVLDPEMTWLLQASALIEERSRPGPGRLEEAIKLCAGLHGREFATEVLRRSLRQVYGDKVTSSPYKELGDAMEASEDQQPLGVAVGEICYEEGIPFVVATSTDHHGILTCKPQEYAIRNGWGYFVDCSEGSGLDKRNPKFWESVGDRLGEKIEDHNTGVKGGKE